MNDFFLWIYRLDAPQIFCLALAGTVLFLFLHSRFERHRIWRCIAACLLLAWFVIVLAQTLLLRGTTMPRTPSLCPFQSYREMIITGNREILRSNLMNAFLFYPAGLLASALLPPTWQRKTRILTVFVLFAAISMGIEYCQYHFARGYLQTDDVIHNTLGALLGALPTVINPQKLRIRLHV